MRFLAITVLLLFGLGALAQDSFDVASVRPSSSAVRFERDGETTLANGTLRMHDVRVLTCIKWAYRLQSAQIILPNGADGQHYDIDAKVPSGATEAQMRRMLQALLAERFGLTFHRGTRETNAYVVTVSPQGLRKMKPAAQSGEAWHQNSSMGMVARNFTMQDFVAYMSDPLGAPLVDETHLAGAYDFTLDFQPYVDEAADIHADPQAVLKSTFAGELGLQLQRRHVTLDTLVVDHLTAPTEN